MILRNKAKKGELLVNSTQNYKMVGSCLVLLSGFIISVFPINPNLNVSITLFTVCEN